jgi:small subunit ribosomal protein S16
MVRIRLKRTGQRNRPFYRIVVTEQSRARDGKYIEALGHYNPRDKKLVVDLERAKHWLAKGAQPSDTAGALLRRYAKLTTPAATEPAQTAPVLPEAAAEGAVSEGGSNEATG